MATTKRKLVDQEDKVCNDDPVDDTDLPKEKKDRQTSSSIICPPPNALSPLDLFVQRCVAKKHYLYGGTKKYNYSKHRENFLVGATIYNQDDLVSTKPWYLPTNSNDDDADDNNNNNNNLNDDYFYLVQGPYQRPKDDRVLTHLIRTIGLLRRIGRVYTSLHGTYSLSVVLERDSVANHAWVVYDNPSLDTGVVSVANCLIQHSFRGLDVRTCVQTLTSLMLKRMLNVGRNTLDHLMTPYGLLFGLEYIRDEALLVDDDGKRTAVTEGKDNNNNNNNNNVPSKKDTQGHLLEEKKKEGTKEKKKERGRIDLKEWFCPTATDDQTRGFQLFQKEVLRHDVACVEFMQVWAHRLESTLGKDSQEYKTWHSMQTSIQLHLFSHIVMEKINVQKCGWPVHVGDRVMFQKEGINDTACLYPGTIRLSDWQHARFDWPSHNEIVERCVQPDDSKERIFIEGCSVRPMDPTEVKLYIQRKDIIKQGFVPLNQL